MNKIRTVICYLLCLLPASILAQATEDEKKYTAFDMRSNGKIYVVVTVVFIILIGMILYLVRIDRKITKLEKELK